MANFGSSTDWELDIEPNREANKKIILKWNRLGISHRIG